LILLYDTEELIFNFSTQSKDENLTEFIMKFRYNYFQKYFILFFIPENLEEIFHSQRIRKILKKKNLGKKISDYSSRPQNQKRSEFFFKALFFKILFELE